jgi:WD40 repeat protein
VAQEKLVRTLRGHEQIVQRVAFSPDGRQIVSGSWDRTVKLWDVKADDDLILRSPAERVHAVSFFPDGQHRQRLVSGEPGGAIRLWQARTGEELRTFYHPLLRSLTVSRDGKRLASGSGNGTVRLWDADTGKRLFTFPGRTTGVYIGGVDAAFGPQDRWLALASPDDTITLYDTITFEPLQKLRGHTKEVTGVAVSPDGARIASCSGDDTLRLWDVPSGRELWWQRLEAGKCLAFSRDGRRIVAGTDRGLIQVWDVASGNKELDLRGHADAVRSVAFSPDGKRVLSGGNDQTIRLWDAETGDEVLTLRGHAASVWQVAFSPDGRTIVSCGLDETLRLWEICPPPPGGSELRQTAAAARSIVDDLFGKHTFSSEVIGALEADRKLAPAVHRAALGITKARGDNPYPLNQEAWAVVQKPGAPADVYALALRKAETAYRVDSDHGPIRTTLGAARYRTGKYQEAVDTLTAAIQTDKGAPADLAFLAMAQYRLGRPGEARAALSRLRQALTEPEGANDPAAKTLLREVEELLKVGAPEPSP